MTNTEILVKALEKAFPKHEVFIYSNGTVDDIIDVGRENPETSSYEYVFCGQTSAEVITSIRFAKAFFGEVSWKSLLMLMIVEEDRIKYLEKFL